MMPLPMLQPAWYMPVGYDARISDKRCLSATLFILQDL